MQYNQPFDQPSLPNAPFVNGNPGMSVAGSIPPAAQMEFPQREIVNAILAASLSPTNSDLTQLAQAMSIGLWLGQMGGTANAISDVLPTLATTSDGVTQYAIPTLQPGMTFHGIIPATNTGPATLTLTGFGTAPGPKNIVRKDGSPLQPGDQIAGATASWKWDGLAFRIVGMVASDVLALIAANGGISYGVDTSTTPGTVTVAALSPAIAALRDGMVLAIDIANPNPGTALAVTVPVNGVATTFQAVRPGGLALRSGDVVAGGQALFVALGGKLQLVNGQAVSGVFSKIVSSPSATYAVQPSDANSLYYIYNPNSVATSTTYNLPNANTMPSAIVSFMNNSGNGITSTINTSPSSGSNYILTVGQSLSSLVLSNQWSYVSLRSDGTNWIVIGNSVDVGFQLTPVSLGSAKYANGDIYNRGVATVGPNSSATVTFPIPFTQTPFMFVNQNVNSPGNNYPVNAYASSLTQGLIINNSGSTLSIIWKAEGR